MPNSRTHNKLAAVVLLSGGRGMASFAEYTGRATLDLPIDGSNTLGTHWRQEVTALATHLALDHIDLLVVGGARLVSFGQDAPGIHHLCRVLQLPDSGEHRGTGGILRDLAARFADDQYLLVSTGSTLLLDTLVSLHERLSNAGAAVAFFAKDDEPANLMLVRCGSLRDLPAVGFVDFKEQAIPKIKSNGSVSAILSDSAPALTMRNPMQYLEGLRRIHSGSVSGSATIKLPPVPAAFAESWMPVFSIIEPGAEVEEGATIHDSVVLRGSRVGRGAIVARSVVPPAAVIGQDTVVSGKVLHAKGSGLKSDARWERS